MAKAKPAVEPIAEEPSTGAVPPAIPLEQGGAFDGDPTVLVRLLSGSDLLECRVKDGKQRQITVDGRSCEHVGEAPDGRWIYQMRAW